MSNAINTKHIDLCAALGASLNALVVATGTVQLAINAVRAAKIKFGKSVRTCPYKQALRDAIVTGKTLTVGGRDVLLSNVMKAIASKSGVYIVSPSKAKGKGKGKGKGTKGTKGKGEGEGEGEGEANVNAAPRLLSAILTEAMEHVDYAKFCAIVKTHANFDAAMRAFLGLKKAAPVTA